MRKLTRALSMLLVCCMMFTLLPVKAEAYVEVSGNTVNFSNYFPAEQTGGESTNGQYIVKGVGVDANGQAYAVIASNAIASLKDLDWFALNPSNVDDNKNLPEEERIYLCNGTNCANADPAHPSTAAHTEDERLYKGDTLNIQVDGSDTIVLKDSKVKGYFVMKLGSFDELMEGDAKFMFAVDSSENGWDISCPGIEITVDLSYEITKEVNKEAASLGDTLVYTVKAENTGEHNIPNVDVWDILPEWLDLDNVSVKRNGAPWNEKQKGAEGDGWYWDSKDTRTIMLDNDITLMKDNTTTTDVDEGEVVYEITAVIMRNCKDDTLINTAYIGSETLAEKQDDATTVIGDSFYIHHIYNDGKGDIGAGVEKRVDKIKITDVNKYLGGKFNVTADTDVPSEIVGGVAIDPATYDGLWNEPGQGKALYGGTFDEDYLNPKGPHKFTPGENGIGFTPEVNEHYYVWEPSNAYLDPAIVAVWHQHGKENNPDVHTIAGYPVAPVDRLQYHKFGFEHLKDPTDFGGVFRSLKLTAPDNHVDTYDTEGSTHNENGNTTEGNTWGLSGFMGLDKFVEDIFLPDRTCDCNSENGWTAVDNEHVDRIKSFTPYWITMDGVKVSVTNRGAWDMGVGTEAKFKRFGSDHKLEVTLETVLEPSPRILTFSACRSDNLADMVYELDPAEVFVDDDESNLIYAGNSDNVKGFTMTADMGEFDFDEAWFFVDGQKKDLTVEAERDGNKITAELNLKKVGEGEVTIVPFWRDGDREYKGSALKLFVEKKMVRADSIGLLTDDEYVEVVPTEEAVETEATEEPVETEATEEVTEEPTETEAVEETTEATEAVEESNKKNDKKNNNKKNDKNDKKNNNKKDEVAETEPVEETVVTEPVEETVETEPTEAPVEIVYEEITTVTFVGISRESASAPVIFDDCIVGSVFQ